MPWHCHLRPASAPLGKQSKQTGTPRTSNKRRETESDVERMFVKKMERQLQSDEENSMASIKQGKLIV